MAPGTFFVSISPLFLDPFGAGAGPGGGVWVGGRVGTWKFPKLDPTHRWLSVGGGGVYVHTTLCKKMTQSKSWIKNSKLFYMYAALLL